MNICFSAHPVFKSVYVFWRVSGNTILSRLVTEKLFLRRSIWEKSITQTVKYSLLTDRKFSERFYNALVFLLAKFILLASVIPSLLNRPGCRWS